MSYATREQLDRAKKVDLLTYLQQCEPWEFVEVQPALMFGYKEEYN